MQRQTSRILVSLALIGVGILILLSNLNLLPIDLASENWFWVAVFGVAGVGFLSVFMGSPAHQWWAAIPALTLIGLAILVGDFFPDRPVDLSWAGAAVFLGMIGLSFLVILLVRPDQWWAIFPAGSLFSVAGVVAVSGITDNGFASGAILFIGLALTFLFVYFRPVDGTRMSWALWPAGILGVMGLLMMVGFASMINYVWAAALILAGAFLLLRGLRR